MPFTALITFSPLLLILVRFQKETLQHVLYIVMWSSLVSRSQRVKVFTWDSFLQMVKNISVLSLVMHFLNELIVNTTLVLKGHLCDQFLLWVACIKHLFHGWWHIWYFQYEPWWCARVDCQVKRWHSHYIVCDKWAKHHQELCWLFHSSKFDIIMNQVLKIKFTKPNWLWYLLCHVCTKYTHQNEFISIPFAHIYLCFNRLLKILHCLMVTESIHQLFGYRKYPK